MLTYVLIPVLTLLFFALGIKGFIKERRNRQRQRLMASAYERLVFQDKLAVDYSEFLNRRYIGLDRRNRKLVLIDHCSDERQEQCISLHEIGESRVIHAKDGLENTRAILLEFENKRGRQPVRFCFYDKDHDPVVELPSLCRKALHWKTRVDIHKHCDSVGFEYVL